MVILEKAIFILKEKIFLQIMRGVMKKSISTSFDLDKFSDQSH